VFSNSNGFASIRKHPSTPPAVKKRSDSEFAFASISNYNTHVALGRRAIFYGDHSGERESMGKLFRFVAAIVCWGSLNTSFGALVDVSLQQFDRTSGSGAMGTIDLTQGGTALDWLKPVSTNLTAAQKASTSLLTLATQGAVFTPGNYADDGYTMSWSGGEAGNESGSSFAGSNNTGANIGVGFRVTFTAPAAGDYVLKWYSAGNNMPNWRLTGSIGAANDFQQAGANVGSGTGLGGVDEFHWTVLFTADNPGQVLTLDLVNTTNTNSAIAITGVTVAAVAVPEPGICMAAFAAILALGLARRHAMR
jgi:hypothetical protein